MALYHFYHIASSAIIPIIRLSKSVCACWNYVKLYIVFQHFLIVYEVRDISTSSRWGFRPYLSGNYDKRLLVSYPSIFLHAHLKNLQTITDCICGREKETESLYTTQSETTSISSASASCVL